MPGPRKDYLPNDTEIYMNSRQRDYFRHQLQQWRTRLRRESRESLERILDNPQPGGDLLDQSVYDSNRAMDFLARKRLEQTIGQIDAALARLQEGSYGYCLESGEEIGIKRLLAYPIATLSVEAQEFRERRVRATLAAAS